MKVRQKPIIRELKVPIFNRKGSLEKFIRDIGKHDPFESPDEEYECAMRVVKGCEESRKELVLRNLRFVIKVASQYNPRADFVCDLIAEGCRGMYEASFKYDPTRGNKFISYAVWYVRMRIINFIAESKVIVPPYNIGKEMQRVKREMAEEYTKNEYVSAEYIEENKKYIDAIERVDHGRVKSLDDHLSPSGRRIGLSESGDTMLDVMEDKWADDPSETTDNEDLKLIIQILVDDLPPRENLVIRRLFAIGQEFPSSIDSVAKELGVTRQTVRTSRDIAFSKMRRRLR